MILFLLLKNRIQINKNRMWVKNKTNFMGLVNSLWAAGTIFNTWFLCYNCLWVSVIFISVNVHESVFSFILTFFSLI